MLLAICFTLLFAFVTQTKQIDFEPCGPNIQSPIAVRLDFCTSEPCKIMRGVEDYLEVDFNSPINTDSLSLDVKGKVFGLWLPWPGIDKDACKNKNLECPLTIGNNYTFKSPIQTLTQYPKLSTTVRYRVLDGNGKNVFCFKMPLHLI